MNLSNVYKQCFQSFRKFQTEDYIIQESMPIAYFGDLYGYKKSKQRIITVGLNPSDKEFPIENPYLRFSSDRYSYRQIIENNNYQLYESLLCQYYKYESIPYMKWFNSFQKILEGMNASYREDCKFPNRVLHTDICSPIASNPTWSKIKPKQNHLLEDGRKIWHSLVRVLQPDLILISIAKEHLKSINFKQISSCQVIHEIKNKKNKDKVRPRKKIYEVKLANFQISDNCITQICFGEAAQTPFGSITNNDKLIIGQKLLQQLT